MTALVVALLAAAPGFGPFGSGRHPVTREATYRAATAEPAARDNFLELSYEFYRRVVSPIDGPRCMHRPTCSRYGLLAVRRYGAVGMLLTVDRLQRAELSSPLRRLRLLQDVDGLHVLDPLEESTFWFSSSH